MRVDNLILSIAAGQHGLVTRQQLKGAGLPNHRIHWRIAAELLRPVHAGVYQVGPVAAPYAREQAAVLACRGATLSYDSAAALWGVYPPLGARRPVHLIPPPGRKVQRPGIVVHRVLLEQDEITIKEGMRVTTPARTLLDISCKLTTRDIERTLAQAYRSAILREEDLLVLLERHARRAGTARLRRIVKGDAAPLLTRSEAEERLLALVRRAGLPDPEMNVLIDNVEVDCYWRRFRLVVEVDGYAFHGSKRAFVLDRKRDSALAASGIQVLRLSWQQLEKDWEKTLVQLAMALYGRRDGPGHSTK